MPSTTKYNMAFRRSRLALGRIALAHIHGNPAPARAPVQYCSTLMFQEAEDVACISCPSCIDLPVGSCLCMSNPYSFPPFIFATCPHIASVLPARRHLHRQLSAVPAIHPYMTQTTTWRPPSRQGSCSPSKTGSPGGSRPARTASPVGTSCSEPPAPQ